MKQIKQTSRESYESVKQVIPTHHKLILSVLSETKEMTYREVSNKVYFNISSFPDYLTWLNPNIVSRRMKELIESKQVKYGETRKCTIGERKCQTYLLNK